LAKDDHPPSKPEDERQAISRIEAVRAQFSGPIPPPSILEAYEKLAAGSADRLIRMAEEEAVHRRSLESQALDSDIQDREAGRKEARFGQVCGLAIGLAAIGCGTYAAVNGAPWFGGFLGTGGVGTLVAIFVWGRRHPRLEGDGGE